MKLIIRNMVSDRCKILVSTELNKLGLHCVSVDIGEVTIEEELTFDEQLQLNLVLKRSGLEVVHNRKTLLVEKIKSIVTEVITDSSASLPLKFSVYLSKQMNYDYHYLSNLFGAHEGTSLEQYIISHKIEKVKSLLCDEKISLSEIAERMHYSSSAHLCNQFKKVVGNTPGVYRQLMRAEEIARKFNQ